MAGEGSARRIVEGELGLRVALNDDNSAAGMYDLRVGPAERPEIAIECVGAVDATLTETWNVGPARGALHLGLTGDWTIAINRDARVSTLRRRIEAVLQTLEEKGIGNLHTDPWLKRLDENIYSELESLGIEGAYCYRREGAGKVYLTMSERGGAVDEMGNSVPTWISDFLGSPAQVDVLEKLRRAGAERCHAFVQVTFGGAPWLVESYLTGSLDTLPAERPNLPAPVDEVWIVSTFGERGIRWNGETWLTFNARPESMGDPLER